MLKWTDCRKNRKYNSVFHSLDSEPTTSDDENYSQQFNYNINTLYPNFCKRTLRNVRWVSRIWARWSGRLILCGDAKLSTDLSQFLREKDRSVISAYVPRFLKESKKEKTGEYYPPKTLGRIFFTVQLMIKELRFGLVLADEPGFVEARLFIADKVRQSGKSQLAPLNKFHNI